MNNGANKIGFGYHESNFNNMEKMFTDEDKAPIDLKKDAKSKLYQKKKKPKLEMSKEVLKRQKMKTKEFVS